MSTDTKMKEAKNKKSNDESSSYIVYKNRKSGGISTGTFRLLRFGNVLQTWTDVSKINYMSALSLEGSKEQQFRSLSILPRFVRTTNDDGIALDNYYRDSVTSEYFSANITSLLNDDQLWGCFYNFPELYDDVYSPIVHIRSVKDVPELLEGVLTRDMVAVCLSYLKRTPILGDYVYIKLDLSSKYLKDISVLQLYKYLVYLDLSSNLLTNLNVLSKLLYLQYLSVDFNRLTSVLDYETPQWFLTEVHYKYNCVTSIRNISEFWSITVLDLSHNNIKNIQGLQDLRYLRHLDLSFNHIQRLENLNHMRLLRLDVSYNYISSFEFGPNVGLWTLLHLEYLNLNENNLTSMKIFSGCTRLRELHARNNYFSTLLEIVVYLRNLRRLNYIDLRSNPVCAVPGYKDVIFNIFPLLLHLDAKETDPVEQRTSKMDMAPTMTTFATRRLLRLLYIQQLSRSRVSQYTPPADTTDVPIVIIVGYEGVGKGSLVRRLTSEWHKVEIALQHTTAFHHTTDHYRVITRREFDDMLLIGDLLTYSEMNGESYGLSREEAFVQDGKVKIATMDLIGALMLKSRGYRPYLILATCSDKRKLAFIQEQRKNARDAAYVKKHSMAMPMEVSTLQVLLSGRIIINGILNEILQSLSDGKENDDFVIHSKCSLMMDSEARRKKGSRDVDRIALTISSSASLADKGETDKNSGVDSSLYSLYKESPLGMDEYVSDVCGQASYQERNQQKKPNIQGFSKRDPYSHPKSTDFKHTSSTWKGFQGSRKSSKSVAFTSPENIEMYEQDTDPSGLMIDPHSEQTAENLLMKSISAKVAWPHADGIKPQDSDLWLAFLLENGLLQASATSAENDVQFPNDNGCDETDFMANQLKNYEELPFENFTTNIQDDYEEIHRNSPGLFWDTVTMDDTDTALKKLKSIIKNIVSTQKNLKPLFDIDFTNLKYYPTIKRKLSNICSQIAPQRLFY